MSMTTPQSTKYEGRRDAVYEAIVKGFEGVGLDARSAGRGRQSRWSVLAHACEAAVRRPDRNDGGDLPADTLAVRMPSRVHPRR
jgi:hypothetical protein